MFSRCFTLIRVSRIGLTQQRTCSFSSNAVQGPLRHVDRGKNGQKDEKDDPDVFGTLPSAKRLNVLEALGSEKLMSKEDLEEEKYISFVPEDRKGIRESEEEVKRLVEAKKLKEAFRFLEVTMKEDKVKPSKGIYSVLITACGRAGYTKKAFSLYNDMKKRGFQPTDSHITSLFNACSNSPWPADGLTRAKKLKEQLAESGRPLNRQHYHAMMKAFGRCGDIPTALAITDEMMANRLPVTTETANFLLQACISRRTDGYKRAVEVWRKMRIQRITPNVYSFNLMLRAARDCGIEEESKTLVDVSLLEDVPRTRLIEPAGQDPSPSQLVTILPNLLMDGPVQSSNIVGLTQLDRSENRLALLGGPEGFLDQMKRDHAAPDLKTFTLLLETMASERDLEAKLLEQMVKSNIKPDVDFFNLMIKKRNFRGDSSGAQEVLAQLHAFNLYPNIMTFGVLALGCRRMDEAWKLFETMDQAGFRVNNEIFGCLLKNAVYRRDCWYLLDLLNRAVKMEFSLDEKAVQLVDRFREETMEKLAKFDRGEQVPSIYGDERFRESFSIFCKAYKPQMAQIKVETEPHPWTQYRYPKKGQV